MAPAERVIAEARRPRPIVLATINAKYIHAAFGLRCLAANLGPLAEDCEILEFTGQQRVADMVEAILAHRPQILGLGVYIWNAEQSRELVSVLRQVAPSLKIVLGGPEVSHELDDQAIVDDAHYVVCGEGERPFRRLCERLLNGQSPLQKVIPADVGSLDDLALPYALYSKEDIRQRVIYVEASRGCPFRCEFCLSALDKGVRRFPIDRFLAAMEGLFDRGVRHFKFVDRTFNLDIETSEAILDFFLARVEPGLFLHFEMIPDRFPDRLRDRIRQFPAGCLQFEVGIQTFDPVVAERIGRRQDYVRLRTNLEFLRTQAGVHLHTDLIVGLPGESMDGFGRGFDELVAMNVQEIQIGILKRLRGAPVARHTDDFSMVYARMAPYEVLSTRDIDFESMQRLKRFAHAWNATVNRGNFRETAPRLWQPGSAFSGFIEFSDWLHATLGRVHGIALVRLARWIATFLIEHRGLDPDEVSDGIRADFIAAGRKDPGTITRFKAVLDDDHGQPATGMPSRQARHASR